MSPALASATFVLIHALEERPRGCGVLTPGLSTGTWRPFMWSFRGTSLVPGEGPSRSMKSPSHFSPPTFLPIPMQPLTSA